MVVKAATKMLLLGPGGTTHSSLYCVFIVLFFLSLQGHSLMLSVILHASLLALGVRGFGRVARGLLFAFQKSVNVAPKECVAPQVKVPHFYNLTHSVAQRQSFV